jgi:hypothetical protein
MEVRVSAIPTASGPSWRRRAALILGVIPTLILAGCSDGPTTPSNSVSFDGVIASETLSGSLSFTVAATTLDVARAPGALTSRAVASPAFATAATEVAVTGTLKVAGGPTIPLSGTYDTSNHTLSLAGGGYSFTGTFANGRIDGTFTSPTESGSFTVQSSTSTTIRNFCGTYGGNSDQGRFNISVNLGSGAVYGRWVSTQDGSSGGLSGTTSGSSITINVEGGGTATGTITPTSVSGTYADGQDTGSFSGSVCS